MRKISVIEVRAEGSCGRVADYDTVQMIWNFILTLSSWHTPKETVLHMEGAELPKIDNPEDPNSFTVGHS